MSSNEWQTVTRGRYVPPSRRAEMEKLAAEEEKKKPLDFSSDKSFPTLGGTAKAAVWGKKTFTETINNLIAIEQRTAEEREAAEEEAKKYEGIQRLALPKTVEEKRAIAERMYERGKKDETELELIELGLHGGTEIFTDFTAAYKKVFEELNDITNTDDESAYVQSYAKPIGNPTVTITLKSTEKTSASVRIHLLERKRQALLAKKVEMVTA